jgi:flagellar hook-length control protein FliK
MTAAWRVGEEQSSEAPDGFEPMEDTSADFQVEPLASGDNPFESPDNANSGSSSPNQREQGSPGDAFQAKQDREGSGGLNRSESDAVFSVPTPANRSVNHAGLEEQAERVNIHEPDWARKISEQVLDRARAGKSSLVVELEPQDLGHLTLRIEADQRHVTAWISTQNEEARNLLLQNASALQKHLAEHGLSLGELTVNVSHDRGNSGGHAGNRETRRTSRVGGRPGRELQNETRVPGVHGRMVGHGSNQTISLVV